MHSIHFLFNQGFESLLCLKKAKDCRLGDRCWQFLGKEKERWKKKNKAKGQNKSQGEILSKVLVWCSLERPPAQQPGLG